MNMIKMDEFEEKKHFTLPNITGISFSVRSSEVSYYRNFMKSYTSHTH